MIVTRSIQTIDGVVYHVFLLSCGHVTLHELANESITRIRCDQCQ